MKVYFYHTQDIQRILREGRDGRFPAHFLYGATHLCEHGIDVIYHRHIPFGPRLKMMLHTAWRILTCRERFDAVYATHYQGLELIVFMRALGLFRRPVVVWHHQPMVVSASRLRRLLGRLFYRGIDRMFFFSEKLLQDSLLSPNARRPRMLVGHWGADLDYYGRLLDDCPPDGRQGFISTGKEHRDMETLVSAFNATGAAIDIYSPVWFGNYFKSAKLGPNISVSIVNGLKPYELSLAVNRHACVVICCHETNYTVGLTTVVEALALGLPMICSRNPQIPIDFDAEECGISVAYGDVEGWKRAIDYIASHPAEAARMGRNARRLAETRFNDRTCAADAAQALKDVAGIL